MARPCIDHSLLSPSGRMSKRARKAALEHEAQRLFEGVELKRKREQPSREETLRRYAAELRALADRGMFTRKFHRLAAEYEAQADKLKG